MAQALEGIRVLDFSQGMAGCLTTMILADFGAEVIRVEPAGGDPGWQEPAYLLWNRGKRSIELDLTSEDGRAYARELIAGSDALVETLRPGDAEELGVDYAAASALNPALVYLSLSGFGQEGPYRRLRAYDGIVNAKAGRMHDQVGWQPMRPNFRAIKDVSYHSAMFAIQGLLAGLRVAWLTGRGQWVETSLLRGITAPNNPWRRFEGDELAPDRYPGEASPEAALRGELVLDRRETDPYKAIPSQLCAECADGRWMMHAHIQFDLFRSWINTIGLGWIWEDPRYKGAPTSYDRDSDRIDLNLMIVDRIKSKTSQEWTEIYRQNPDCAGEIMQTTQEALHRSQFVHMGHVVEVDDPRVGTMHQVGPFAKLSETPAVIGRPAPVPGDDTADVLAAEPRRLTRTRVTGPAPKRPLEGIVVLELASWLAAPFAGALLADLGAWVIKVEPLSGDPMRALKTNENGIRATQGKESLAVDLKTAEGQQILHRLVAGADVVMHNFRPGVSERIGLDYETLQRIKPDLVYVYASGYGSSGPDSKRAAFNPTMGAFAGNSVFQSGEGNKPLGDQSPDPISGSGVATAVMLGLAAKWRTGKGQLVETTMMNSVVYCNSDDAFYYEGKPPRHNPDGAQLGLEATYRLYETAEGWVFLAVPRDDEFTSYCEHVRRPDLAADRRYSNAASRYANRVELGAELEEVFRTATADEWETRLTAADLGCVRADRGGYRRFLYEDPHATAVGFMVPTAHQLFAPAGHGGHYRRHAPVVNFSETPCEEGLPYSAIGEQTRKILGDLGYDNAEIDQLKQGGVVSWPSWQTN